MNRLGVYSRRKRLLVIFWKEYVSVGWIRSNCLKLLWTSSELVKIPKESINKPYLLYTDNKYIIH